MTDSNQDELVATQPSTSRGFLCWLNWTTAASSAGMLRAAEKKLLSFLRTPYRGWYVDIGSTVGESDKIWTISLNTELQKTPLVLLHGMGAGVAFWVLNMDALAQHRPVYAIDVLGFGRSSRPSFSSDAMVAEKQLVRSIEEWRREMNIKNMILLGHSMGGFLATSYTMSHPERVKHLILADPWGFPERPKEIASPLWVRAIAYMVTPMNPLWALRAAGPYGQLLVQKTRPDILRKFQEVVQLHEASEADSNNNLMAQYIYQCNAQQPTGESAFHAMMSGFGWAKNPMLNRIHEMKDDKTITLLYGSRSWIDKSSWDLVKRARGSSFVNTQVVSGAGHHVFADKPDLFNQYVNDACHFSDNFAKSIEETSSQSTLETTNESCETLPTQDTNGFVPIPKVVEPPPVPILESNILVK